MRDGANPVRTAALLGRIGLPEPVRKLAARDWDAVIVGAGHNGLACAAYLARAGRDVIVLESREQIGGACTLEEPWPDVRVSPCAYLCGLLHPVVVSELGLIERGFKWTAAEAGLFVPFEDGYAIQLWEDSSRCETEIQRFASGDVAGWRAMSRVIGRTRDALRPPNQDDLWLNPEPTREEIERRLHGDPEARSLLFEWSMADFLEHFLGSERLQTALLGQGVIGTNASPFDPGTASIHFHHSSGRMSGNAGAWGYVTGGIGVVSFLLCDIAREAGAMVAAGVPVARILPGRGVELEGGEFIRAPAVISNADPQTSLRLLDAEVDAGWKEQVESIPMEGCTVKANLLMSELPDFRARPGVRQPHHYGQVNTPLSKAAWRTAFDDASDGNLPKELWTELYFQTAADDTIAPKGKHVVSVFAQYVPYAFRNASWDEMRADVRRLILSTLARFCSNVPGAVIDMQVQGPPDIEQKVGLHGGHIFQGECLPAYMWDRRLTCRTPMNGFYLCGAGTHPGGSVIGVNGRNAAMAVIASEHDDGG